MSGDALDTNVILYYFQDVDERKQRIASGSIGAALRGGDTVISYQVVQETLSVLTRQAVVSATRDEIENLMDTVLLPLWKILPTPDMYRSALELRERYQLHF